MALVLDAIVGLYNRNIAIQYLHVYPVQRRKYSIVTAI